MPVLPSSQTPQLGNVDISSFTQVCMHSVIDILDPQLVSHSWYVIPHRANSKAMLKRVSPFQLEDHMVIPGRRIDLRVNLMRPPPRVQIHHLPQCLNLVSLVKPSVPSVPQGPPDVSTIALFLALKSDLQALVLFQPLNILSH